MEDDERPAAVDEEAGGEQPRASMRSRGGKRSEAATAALLAMEGQGFARGAGMGGGGGGAAPRLQPRATRSSFAALGERQAAASTAAVIAGAADGAAPLNADEASGVLAVFQAVLELSQGSGGAFGGSASGGGGGELSAGIGFASVGGGAASGHDSSGRHTLPPGASLSPEAPTGISSSSITTFAEVAAFAAATSGLLRAAGPPMELRLYRTSDGATFEAPNVYAANPGRRVAYVEKQYAALVQHLRTLRALLALPRDEPILPRTRQAALALAVGTVLRMVSGLLLPQGAVDDMVAAFMQALLPTGETGSSVRTIQRLRERSERGVPLQSARRERAHGLFTDPAFVSIIDLLGSLAITNEQAKALREGGWAAFRRVPTGGSRAGRRGLTLKEFRVALNTMPESMALFFAYQCTMGRRRAAVLQESLGGDGAWQAGADGSVAGQMSEQLARAYLTTRELEEDLVQPGLLCVEAQRGETAADLEGRYAETWGALTRVHTAVRGGGVGDGEGAAGGAPPPVDGAQGAPPRRSSRKRAAEEGQAAGGGGGEVPEETALLPGELTFDSVVRSAVLGCPRLVTESARQHGKRCIDAAAAALATFMAAQEAQRNEDAERDAAETRAAGEAEAAADVAASAAAKFARAEAVAKARDEGKERKALRDQALADAAKAKKKGKSGGKK